MTPVDLLQRPLMGMIRKKGKTSGLSERAACSAC